MIEWATTYPIFATVIALAVLLFGTVVVVNILDTIEGIATAGAKARTAEAKVRAAEAKARHAELVEALQPPYPSTAEQMAATPGHPSLRKSRVPADVPD